MVVHAELHIMLVNLPREIVDHLDVAIHAVPRNAAGRTELRYPAHQDDGETSVGGT